MAERVLARSGVPTTHLRVTFFAEWLLYTAHLIREGLYVAPFDPNGRFAPMAGIDIARVVVGILENPGKHSGKAYPLHGPVEYSHLELSKVPASQLKKEIRYEQVGVDNFLAVLGLPDNEAMRSHFNSVRQDQQEGLLRGLDETGAQFIDRPSTMVPDFIELPRSRLA